MSFPEHSSTPFGPIHFFLMAMLEWMNVGFINSKKTNLHYFNEVLEILSIIAWIWASISGGIFVTSGTDNLFKASQNSHKLILKATYRVYWEEKDESMSQNQRIFHIFNDFREILSQTQGLKKCQFSGHVRNGPPLPR